MRVGSVQQLLVLLDFLFDLHDVLLQFFSFLHHLQLLLQNLQSVSLQFLHRLLVVQLAHHVGFGFLRTVLCLWKVDVQRTVLHLGGKVTKHELVRWDIGHRLPVSVAQMPSFGDWDWLFVPGRWSQQDAVIVRNSFIELVPFVGNWWAELYLRQGLHASLRDHDFVIG